MNTAKHNTEGYFMGAAWGLPEAKPTQTLLFRFLIPYENDLVPVTVYLMTLSPSSFYNRAVTREGTAFQQSMDMDRNEEGIWIDLDHGGNDLVAAIGAAIEYEVNQHINSVTLKQAMN